MAEYWIALNSLSAEGQTLVVDNPTLWTEPIVEFELACTILTPLRAELLLLPQEGGCFVRGRMTGTIELPCDRCAEPARVVIDQRIESYEPLPLAPRPEQVAASGSASAKTLADTDEEADAFFDEEADASVMRIGENGPELNLAAFLWEEFSLALPVHPLCQASCHGLCPMCGKNLNEGACACVSEEGDPRLALLRNLTITS